MSRWLFFTVLLSLSACLTSTTAPATETPVPTETPTTPSPAYTRWEEFDHDGVTVRIRLLDGWESMVDDRGILLAEHVSSESNSYNIEPDGMLVYIFVPPVDKLELHPDPDANMAWRVLDHVAKMPAYVGDAHVSDTVAFEWHGHPAAYYTLTGTSDSRTMVVAVEMPTLGKVVVANISAPVEHAHRIRAMLPLLFMYLTVNDTTLGSDSLTTLPDPLDFPAATVDASPEASPSVVE